MKAGHYKQWLTQVLLILFLGSTVCACADVYQWQDSHGKIHFSDHGNVNDKKLDIKPGYSWYRVEHVYDGDTVNLSDGRKIRLLGINTPEVQHKNQETEAGGEAAKSWLTAKLQNAKVRVMTDVEQTDKYQRLLAHLFTDRNEHVNLELVKQGLAEVNIYPPNLLYVDQLLAAEKLAEQAKRGIWGLPEYAAIPIDQIADNDLSGWVRLSGKVLTKRSSRKYVYLHFSSQFQARIEKKWLSLFPDIDKYAGNTIEVRGWVNKNGGAWIMPLRHPSAIKVLKNAN